MMRLDLTMQACMHVWHPIAAIVSAFGTEMRNEGRKLAKLRILNTDLFRCSEWTMRPLWHSKTIKRKGAGRKRTLAERHTHTQRILDFSCFSHAPLLLQCSARRRDYGAATRYYILPVTTATCR